MIVQQPNPMGHGSLIIFHEQYACFFNLSKIFSLEAVQNGGKLNILFLAWTEVYYQSFGGWELQTMWNLQKNARCVRESMFSSKMFTNGLNMG